MLAGLTRKLTETFDAVGVVGRTPSRLQALQSFSERIVGIEADYSDAVSLTSKLDRFVERYGRPRLIVSWIHSTSPDAPLVVANYCDSDFYDITGLDGAKPTHISRERQKIIQAKGIMYHRIILGGYGNRWLTNQEISDGAYAAVQSGEAEFVIGEL